MSAPKRLSLYAWWLAVLAQLGLMFGAAIGLPGGWLMALVLALPMPWMLPRSRYAHAANSLVIVVVLGALMVFLDQPVARALAYVGALAFTGSVLFVKWNAVERRAELGVRKGS